MTPIIIALTGLAGAGKDTVADCLVTHAGFTKLAFADGLRMEVATAYDLGDLYGVLSDRASKERPLASLALGFCDDADFIEAVCRSQQCRLSEAMLDAPRSPRTILQWWGTEYRRAQDPDYWVGQALRRIEYFMTLGHERFVVSDCRFENEAAAIRQIGGEVWQVVRPGLQPVEGGHASQTDGNKLTPDIVLHNGRGIVDLAHTTLRALTLRHGGAVLPDDLLATE